MHLFDVYPVYPIAPVRASGSWLWDSHGDRYLDLYGGHAVISIGHTHPHYVSRLETQLRNIGFYSNSVEIPQQVALATLLGRLSGYEDYALFLINSGAEANENALKLASFHTGRSKVIAFSKAFHGRTSMAVAATDDPAIVAPVNQTGNVVFLPFNDEAALAAHLDDQVAAVIIEGMQGVGGVQVPTDSFLRLLEQRCRETGAVLILDEIQSGYGRSGQFFAHQRTGIRPDLITVAKGMGNGFPVAGVLISPRFQAKHSMLGTTFGGNYLACAAATAVLEVIESEKLMEHAGKMGHYLMSQLKGFPGIAELRGRGLMIGIELDRACAPVRNELVHRHKIFTGSSSNKNTLRLLPALNVEQAQLDMFLEAFSKCLT